MSEGISKNKEAIYKEALQKAKNKIEQLQAENAQLSSGTKKCEIAVTGYSCRFPSGANSPEEYWKRLADGFDAVSKIKRFDADAFYSSEPGIKGKMSTKYASFLDINVKEFDNIHFNISDSEAISLDPQYRLLMEVCWEALLDAGEDPEKLKNSKTGVFIGIDSSDYLQFSSSQGEYKEIGPYSLIGVSHHASAGRISYYYDWKGPAMVCNTACSSSLSALNCAVNSLKNGQCDMAVVGGVNLMLSPLGFVGLSQFNALSSDGRCKTFDASADGFGRGEGCGVIILKRLDEAEKQGCNIKAVVKGIYAGQDGKSNGFYAPNGKAEQIVIENAINNAMVSVDDIDYIETHGTGTVVGDLIESQAICSAFKKKKNKLKIGSVKSNMGHLEAASGMASIIKVLLSMKHHMLPPSINIKQLNPDINWNKLEVVRSLTEWKKEDNSPLIAGVSCFGISGALVHAIFESYEKNNNKINDKLPEIPYSLFTVSANNEKELLASVKAAKDFIEENKENFNDIMYSMQKCRSTLPLKYALCGKSSEEICAEIQASLENKELYKSNLNLPATKKHKIAFMFTGQGYVYKNIAVELYKNAPVYRESFNKCSEFFTKYFSISICDTVFGENDEWKDRSEYSQAVSFSVEYSLYQYLISLGIEPEIMLGHDIGEYTAACVSGVMTLEDAIQMISACANKHDYSEKISLRKPDKTIISAISLDSEGSVWEDRRYWNELLSKTVHFDEAIKKAKDFGADIFIEIGGDAVLTELSVQCLGINEDIHFFSSMKKGMNAYAQITEIVRYLYLNGAEISFDALYSGFHHSYTDLYPYQFCKKEFWIGETSEMSDIVTISAMEYVAPRNDIEKKLCEIFSELLGTEKVGIKDNFFDLGGNSLRATKLVNRIEAETGIRIALMNVFSNPTVEQLAVLAGAEAEEYVPIPKAEEKEYYPMSSAQKRTYLIQQMQPESITYNLPTNMKLTGEVDTDKIKSALQEMTDRHEILRTQFLMIDGEPMQKILPHVEADFEYVTSNETDEKLMAEYVKPFDLASGKLVRIKN